MWASNIGSKLASYVQYDQPLSDAEVAGLAAAFCKVVADWLTEATSALLCTARALQGGLARRRLLATTTYSVEAVLASGAPINATLAAQLSTVDGAKLFINKVKMAIATAVITPSWTIIPDRPITFYQMELLSPVTKIYGSNGSLLLLFKVPKTYMDGNVSLTFRSIAVGSVPRVHTYAVPFVGYESTEFRKVIDTKDLADGTYNLFVEYVMRKYNAPRNATARLVIDFDDCSTAECNNGTCVNGQNSFSCACDAGYSGKSCETNIDDCVGVTCLNGAICQDSVGDYECLCPPGYFGKNCGSQNDACAANVCANGAKCTADDASAPGYVCECLQGFVGVYCGTDINECATGPCLNGGTCEDLIGSYSCLCVEGWEGEQCQVNPNDCMSVAEPCKNGARCMDRVGSFKCACLLGWSGSDCTIDVDECLSFPCENGGRCAQGLGSFECTCVNGFEGDYFPLTSDFLFTHSISL
jgi:hypothetical protein